jgi:hypothetical protein
MVLKYRGGLHRYIQAEMEFLDICPWVRPIDMSSKSSRSLNKRRDNLGLGTPHSKKRKGQPQPTEQRTEKIWTTSGQPAKPQAKKDTGKTKKDTGKWCDFHKSP